MNIAIILPVHNRSAMTVGFLDSLVTQSVDAHLSVIVIDDGSTDDTPGAIREWSNINRGNISVSLLTGDGSLWWAGATNLGFEALRRDSTNIDWIYLGNNDTVLDPNHLQFLVQTATENSKSIVGARSFEIWIDGHRHPVSSGFLIDPATLETLNVPGTIDRVTEVDALSGRGILLPARVVTGIRMYPTMMPQHFADIAMTSDLRNQGYRLLIDHRAASVQTQRAGSSVEFQPRVSDFLQRRSALYMPALATFWWQQSSVVQRMTLPARLAGRFLRQARSGHYAMR